MTADSIPQAATPAPDAAAPKGPTPWTRRAGVIVFLLPAITALGMIVLGISRSGDRADVFTESQRDLAKAVEVLPFTARLPQTPPAGARLVRVLLDEPDEKRGPSIYALDLTYTVAGDLPKSGEYVRVWQTNDVYLKKRLADPTLDRGDPQQVGGGTWFRKDGRNEDKAPGVSFSRRFDDGVTMVVSGPDESMVREAISLLAPHR